jgi:hypothetical protein
MFFGVFGSLELGRDARVRRLQTLQTESARAGFAHYNCWMVSERNERAAMQYTRNVESMPLESWTAHLASSRS